jgi:hypothetical protein
MKRAAAAWCNQINTLTAKQQGNIECHYILFGEQVIYERQDGGASILDMVDHASLRPLDEWLQPQFPS